MIKKYVGVASLVLLSSLVVISGELERKEQFARDQFGNIVPSSASSEAEIAALEKEVGQLKQKVNQAKVEMYADSLPFDVKKNIASYLEEDKYVLWKKLNVPVGELAFSDNGESLVLAGLEPHGNQWEVRVTTISMKTGEIVNQWTIQDLIPFRSMPLLSGNGQTIAVIKGRDSIDVWDIETKTKTRSIALERSDELQELRNFSPDGTVLEVLQRSGNSGVLFDLKTEGTFPFNFDRVYSRSSSSALSNDTFCFVSGDNTIHFRDTSNGLDKTVEGLNFEGLKEGTTYINNISFNREGTTFAVCYYNSLYRGSQLFLFDYDSHRNVFIRKDSTTKTYPFHGLIALSNNGKIVVSIGSLYSTLTGKEIQEIPVAFKVKFSPDYNIMAIAHKFNDIQLWKKSTALQDALEKQQQVEEFRAQKIRSSSGGSSSSSSSSSLPASDSAGAPSVLPPMSDVEQAVEGVGDTVMVHVPSTAEPSTTPDIDMDQPD